MYEQDRSRSTSKDKYTCIYAGCSGKNACIGACLAAKAPGDYFEGANLIGNQRKKEEDLICEALVDEIREASRWIAVVNAWQALLNVRRMGRALREESEYLREGSGASEPTRAA